jgi:hypothetical protein
MEGWFYAIGCLIVFVLVVLILVKNVFDPFDEGW